MKRNPDYLSSVTISQLCGRQEEEEEEEEEEDEEGAQPVERSGLHGH